MTARRGTTLIELVVVLAVLGLVAGMTAVAFRAPTRPHAPTLVEQIRTARETAIRTGQPVALVAEDSGTPRAIRALPDGRVLADEALGIDVATGIVRDATR